MTARALHVGTATVLLTLDGRTLLTDPVLDPPGSSYVLGKSPLSGELRYTNLTGPSGVAQVPQSPDIVLLSHDHHRDNLDHAGLEIARAAGRVLTTRAGAERLRRKGLTNVVGLSAWDQVNVDGLRVTATPARHGTIGTNWIAGDVIGFVLESESLRLGSLYITGDTHWFGGTAEVGRRFSAIGTILAHVGAARFGRSILRRWLRFSMNAEEARSMAEALAPAQFVPIHYEGWSHFTEGRQELEEEFARTSLQDRLRFLPRGEQVALEPG